MRFELEKYKGVNTRHTCPSCGTRREFARYIDADGNYLDETVGKCNRDSKCGYHRTPKEFFIDNPGFQPRQNKPRFIPKPETKKPDFIGFEVLRDSLGNYEQNSFVQFLLTLFSDDVETVWQAVSRYFLGTDHNKVIFWQIDKARNIRTGKTILYNSQTGKRIAETFVNPDGVTVEIKTNWIHAQMKRKGQLSSDFNLVQCFFGEHLLRSEASKPVAIVEAEKTAVIASMWFSEFVWLASGGKLNLKADKLKRFADRQIILYPDADGFTRWREIAHDARRLGLAVKVSALIENKATDSQKVNGYDLADYLISERREINEFNNYADCYNEAVDSILSDDYLFAKFEEVLEEQKSILMIDGGLSEAEAEAKITDFNNVRQIVFDRFA